jgi:metal-sulfur cluster biosynthetic enzyme
MVMGLINANPVIHEKKERRVRQAPETTDENAVEPIDQLEIFDILLYDLPNMNVVKLVFFCYTMYLKFSIWAIWLWPLTFLHHIRDIKDPEHPYSLEQLNVVTEDSIELNDERNYVRVTFTPTVEHCSMATVIGLCIRVKLIRSLPPRYKVDIRVAPGSHSTEAAVNKQLNDKERVAAALENPNLLDMVEECLSPTFDWGLNISWHHGVDVPNQHKLVAPYGVHSCLLRIGMPWLLQDVCMNFVSPLL